MLVAIAHHLNLTDTPLGFRAPHWGDTLMVALAGVGNGIAQFWWTRSLSLAPPSAVVPFNYYILWRETLRRRRRAVPAPRRA
jgi:drug/metabolite transporter (DMT)-like permease